MSENQKFKATDAANEFEERIIEIRRVSKVTKGGKTISFRAVSVVGNRNGKVGLGVGNAREVPQAIRKAVQNAHKNLIEVPVKKMKLFLMKLLENRIHRSFFYSLLDLVQGLLHHQRLELLLN